MFQKYSSIENTYRKKYLEKVLTYGYGIETYVVQEKAHGANLSFWSDNGTVFKVAKRTGWISDDESFYGVQDLARQLQGKFEELWNRVLVLYPTLKELAVFGELIGGHYEHSDVIKAPDAKKIQNGIQYSPQHDFYAFDIKVDGEYILLDEAISLLEAVGFLYAAPLFEGSLEDAFAYPNKFETTIPKILGLPPIKDNFCEGVIIKPIKPLRLSSGSRVIFKNKNEAWSEKSKIKSLKGNINLAPEVQEGLSILHSYITENRFNNVVSKIGEVTREDFKTIIKAFSKDIIEDFVKENTSLWEGLKKTDQKVLTKSIGQKAARIINENT